jgi:hypothetical protein
VIRPSQVMTPALVERLIADPSTDDVTRAALEDRLQVMTAPPSDPFRHVVQADYAMDEVF